MAGTDKSHPMTDDELLGIIAEYEKDAMGSSVATGVVVYPNTSATLTTLELDNYYAWNTYNALPMGNEQADRSQVVLPVLRDVIEWIMPQLMRVFSSADRICRFEPEGPNDEELADQQTDVCNYIFMRMNDGFNVLYDYIKEALLLRNGYMKAEWVTKRAVKIERYTGLDEDAVTKLVQDAEEEGDEIEFIGKDERMVTTFQQASQPTAQPPPPQGIPGQPQMPGQPPMPGGQGMPPALHIVPQVVPVQTPVFDIKLKRISKHPQVEVTSIPRENVYVSPQTRAGLDESPYYCHKEKKSRSVLIMEGYDKDLVNEAPPGPPNWLKIDDLARARLVDELNLAQQVGDKSSQLIEVRDVTLRVDYDGDGVAELRRVVIVGEEIAENEEIEEGSIASGVCIRTPHRHLGLSLYELLKDLQAIKTDLMRQALDNVYLVNNTRVAVDQDNVNFEDFQTNRPGGLVRTKGPPGQLIQPLEVANVLPDIQAVMGYVDELQQWRTGVGADTTILNPDELQNVTKANAQALLSKSELKIEQMARLLAEGIKDIFRKINNLVIRHQDKTLVMQLRGKWVKIDPGLWKTRTAVSINVGLGSGNRDEMRANLMMLGQLMQTAKQAGMVSPQNGYNFFKKSVETLGFNSPDEFITDPDSPQGQQLQKSMQQPPLPLMIAQAKSQADMAANQQNAQLEIQKTQAQQQAETAKSVFQSKLQAAIQAEKVRLDAQAKFNQTAADLQAEREKAYIQLAAQITEAALRAQAQPQQIVTDMSAAERAVRGGA